MQSLKRLWCIMQVFQGLVLASRDRLQDDAAARLGSNATGGAAAYLACLWAHECCRVFCDKMVSHEDKVWIENAITDIAK